MFFISFIFLYLMSTVCFYAIVYSLINSVLTLDALTCSGYNWLLKISYDYISLFVLIMLLICFCYVLNYTNHYFSNSEEGNNLNKIIFLFVCIMAMLVSTGDFLLTLIFWEYLGVVSFFLILFYMSYMSLRSSIITLVSSRFGDVALFILIALSCYFSNNYLLGLILVSLVIFTKSASFPFISWLLEAMRAPTPVSSLVHSSTLVAAGVWFSMRYDFNLLTNELSIFSTLLIVTIFITGLCCFYFIDLKKIVALSTCNNIAWCVFYLIFGDVTLSLFQLVSHGVSKCMLFMLVGDIMSGSFGSQASNGVYSTIFYNNWNIFSLFCVVTGLSGVPFIGVFFTKHFLITNFSGIYNLPLMLGVLVCIFLSYFYSFRLCSILLNSKSSCSIGIEYFFNTSFMIYFWLCINFFISFYLDELVYLSQIKSLMLLLFQLISCYTAVFFYNSVLLSYWSSSLFGCDNVVESLYNLYYKLLSSISILFTRWDALTITNFYNIGLNSLSLLGIVLLNILIFVVFWFLMCWVII